MTGRSLGVAAIAAAFTLGAMTTVPASAEPAGNPIIELKSVAKGQCMTATTTDHFLVELADCTGAPNQRWEEVAAPDGNSYLRNIADRKCLDAEFAVAGDQCDETDQVQRWRLETDASGARKLRVSFGWYASTAWYGGEFHIGITTEEPQDTDDQRWEVTEVGTAPARPDTTGAAISMESSGRPGRCADGIAMVACPGSPFQRVELGGGVVQLRTETGCLRAKPDQRHDNVVDLLGDCTVTDRAQQWQLTSDLFGGHLVRNVDRGTYLTPLATDLGHFYKGFGGPGAQVQRWVFTLAGTR
ncbi:RICIN domain-containing protein [Lentzea alba]|uniref:RICIN domain-containing protein n=1 Tax=Lentzea alba TaxID=2714351 RepID=UPI0039BEF7DA